MTKLQLALCAKNLPAAARYRAVVVKDKDQSTSVGSTEVLAKDTTDPEWTHLIGLDDDAAAATFTVQVYSGPEKGDSSAVAVASATFAVEDVLAAPQAATVKSTSESEDGNAVIGVQASEIRYGTLQLQLAARDLPDADFGLQILRKQHSDPFFELFASTGRKLATSNVVQNNLNPVWHEQTVDLEALCGNDTAQPVRIMVRDEDRRGANELLGGVHVTVDQLVELGKQKSEKASVPLVARGKKPAKGRLLVPKAQLVPQQTVSREARTALRAAVDALTVSLEQVQARVDETARAEAEAQPAADAARKRAEELEAEAEKAAARHEQAAEKLAPLERAAQQASEQAKQAPCSGQLRLQLAALDLPDTDFGLRNKTDGIYEVYNPVTTQKVMRSTVVKNDLNPVWEAVTLDLMKLCHGQLDTPFQITVSDQDGADKREYLGLVKKSVNELLRASPTDAFTLENQKSKGHAQLVVRQAELVGYKNHQQEVERCRAACEVAQQELATATEQFKKAQEAADAAIASSGDAVEAAQQAHDAAEAARQALARMELG